MTEADTGADTDSGTVASVGSGAGTGTSAGVESGSGTDAPATVQGRGGRLDPDLLAALEEERDFLLQSLDDLERERAAGDVDDHDYVTLRDEYTARAAVVLRAIDEGRDAFATAPRASAGRRVLMVGAVVLVAVLAGVLVAQASGRRGSDGLTGRDVVAASGRLSDCVALERDDPDAGLACYSEILDAVPANADALAGRGWLQIREFDIADGIADLDAAVQLAPDGTAAYLFRAIGRSRSGDPVAALTDLRSFVDNDPSEEERTLADGLRSSVVGDALAVCIDGDVTGDLGAAAVLGCYDDALAVDPGNAQASVYLGWLLARSGVADDDARALLDAGLTADPTLSQGYVFRAALLAHVGEVDAALADLDTFDALDAPPDQVAVAGQVRDQIESGQDPLA